MRGCTLLGVLLLALAVTGCKEKRQRRPRQAPPPTAAVEEPPPPPPPRPVAEAPRPVPVPPPRPAAKPADRSVCGPAGKGPQFAVRGVDASDTLNVRAEPNAQATVLGELPPDARGVVAVGEQQKVGASTWRKVKCGSLVGWVNERFLARM